MLMTGIYIAARVKKLPRQPWPGFREIFNASLAAAWGLFLIVIILGGISGGIFTPTEAPAVAAVYAFVIALFVYRDMLPLQGVPLFQDPDGLCDAAPLNTSPLPPTFTPALFPHPT